MPEQKRKLILIAGIPGTGKTYMGNFLAKHHGFKHFDVEAGDLHRRLWCDPSNTIDYFLEGAGDVVVTWGLAPDPYQTEIVDKFKKRGLKLVWFDGNRDAALREYIKRGSPVEDFHAQMGRIEGFKENLDSLKPIRIDSFDKNGKFKPPEVILEEIERG